MEYILRGSNTGAGQERGMFNPESCSHAANIARLWRMGAIEGVPNGIRFRSRRQRSTLAKFGLVALTGKPGRCILQQPKTHSENIKMPSQCKMTLKSSRARILSVNERCWVIRTVKGILL